MLLREIVMYRKEVARKIQHMNFLKSVGHRHSVGHCHPALPSSAVSRVLSSLLEEVTVRIVARRRVLCASSFVCVRGTHLSPEKEA